MMVMAPNSARLVERLGARKVVTLGLSLVAAGLLGMSTLGVDTPYLQFFACLVVMGICLLFFATAVRNLLRSAEPSEATWSSVAYAGWIVVTASLSQLVVWNWALVNGAAGSTDDEAVRILGYGHFFGWAGLGIGLATALVAMGLGGLRGAVLPRWFAVTSVVFGVLGALGNAGIPPGGLVTYLLLPFWLLAAAVIIARQQRGPTGRVADDTPELSGATG